MLVAIQGQTYHPKPIPKMVDLRNLHPRGNARFAAADTQQRISRIHNPSKSEEG
jgi:hypothetical protein